MMTEATSAVDRKRCAVYIQFFNRLHSLIYYVISVTDISTIRTKNFTRINHNQIAYVPSKGFYNQLTLFAAFKLRLLFVIDREILIFGLREWTIQRSEKRKYRLCSIIIFNLFQNFIVNKFLKSGLFRSLCMLCDGK